MGKLIKPFLLVSKPFGITSRKFLNEISFLLKEKKLGHSGTLDPIATGLLFVGIGKGTRFIPYLPFEIKEYVIEITFGILTDTLDITGKVLDKKEVPSLNEYKLTKATGGFIGEIMQTPPLFSAKKHKGKELYKYAYSGETEIPIKPSKISIHSIDLLSFSSNKAILRVSCSKGTYMRSLARDIGEALNTYGIISAIARTKIGNFGVSQAATVGRIRNGYFDRGFFDFEEVFASSPKIVLKDEKNFVSGKDFKEGDFFIVELNDRIVGLAKMKNGVLHPEVVIDENS